MSAPWGADNNGIRTFRDVDIVGTTGDDLDGNAEKNALWLRRRLVMGERFDESGRRRRLEGSYDLWGAEYHAE